jgi:hypothetical protein
VKRCLAVLAMIAVPMTLQAQFTITFDAADSYEAHGLIPWLIYTRDVAGYAPNPYLAWTNAPTSGTGVTYNFAASDNPASIRRSDGGTFTFNSGFFTSLLTASEGMYFRGYSSLASYQASRDFVTHRTPDLNDGAYYLVTDIVSSAPTLITLDWQNVAVLELGSTGGVSLDPLGLSGDNFEGFAGDDLRFDYAVAPEPSSLILLATGCVVLLALGRWERSIRTKRHTS